MISSYNLEKLKGMLKDFYTLTKIRITFFDSNFHELAAYPKDIAKFCQIIRTDEAACKKCIECDKNACQTAKRIRTTYTYRCHAGLTESIVPLFLGNIVIGYLLFGHVFPYKSHKEGWNNIKKLCQNYEVDIDDLKNACYKRPIISKKYITSATHILKAVASYICMDKVSILQHKDLIIQIDEYITKHFSEDINVNAICNHFQIGKTHLYEIAKQIYDVGIAEHIRNLKIEKAKFLLKDNVELNVSEIASICGFKNYTYFITLFKKLTGLPPKKFRDSFN